MEVVAAEAEDSSRIRLECQQILLGQEMTILMHPKEGAGMEEARHHNVVRKVDALDCPVDHVCDNEYFHTYSTAYREFTSRNSRLGFALFRAFWEIWMYYSR